MRNTLLTVVAATLLSACGSEPAQDESARFAALLDEHFDRSLELNPVRATSIGAEGYDAHYNFVARNFNPVMPKDRELRRTLNTEFLTRL